MDGQHHQERRAPGVRRVGLATLVEICGRAPGVPAFEAESVEVSGRGMHVRTDYLPEVGDPLVLRFDYDGKPVVVEGEVAWRSKTGEGSEFGIKFTALDTNSVAALKQLCSEREPDAKTDRSEPSFEAPAGAAVKLHIGGLGAPMKARVFRGSERRLHVGSQLEFLRVGKELELEQVDAGAKRAALIDAVSVALDPQTQIPQLVVSLRYDGVPADADSTPEPSVVDRPPAGAGSKEPNASEMLTPTGAPAAMRSKSRQVYKSTGDHALTESRNPGLAPEAENADERYSEEFAEYEDVDPEETDEELKQRLQGVFRSAGGALGDTTRAARKLTDGVSSLLQGVGSGRRGQKPVRRTTERGPRTTHGFRDPSAQRLRPQSARRPEPGARKNPKLWAAGAVALITCASGAYVLSTDDPPEVVSASPATMPTPTSLPVANMPGTNVPALPANSATAGAALTTAASDLSVMPPGLELGQLPPGQFPEPATLNTKEQEQVDTTQIIAKVPLFGETPMSTAEPAPLTPKPPSGLDEYGLAKDQSFHDKAAPPTTSGKKQWQVGRMHLPVIHRLRLDSPGEALQGEKTPSGFSVLIPGRQVKERGSHIAKRDNRITDVRVRNTPAGGKVVFRFEKKIPGFKVRLRNDFIEFFINSPDAD